LTLPSTLFRLIAQAYGIRGCGPETDCVLITGGLDWVRKDAFDLQAKMPDDSPDYTTAQFRDGKAPQLELMLQALLAERFNLKFHRETKELPVYVLTVVKKGPKLETAKGEKVQAKDGTFVTNRSMLWTFPREANGEFNQSAVQMLVRDRSIQELTDALSGLADHPVLNRTGLTGEFDITMQYDRDTDGPDDAGPGGGLFGPSMFKAFQNELGLKFESTKGPVEVLVIDHAEKPSEN
jgi:uncharacterized protein (TIGR03435 family)